VRASLELLHFLYGSEGGGAVCSPYPYRSFDRERWVGSEAQGQTTMGKTPMARPFSLWLNRRFHHRFASGKEYNWRFSRLKVRLRRS